MTIPIIIALAVVAFFSGNLLNGSGIYTYGGSFKERKIIGIPDVMMK